MPDQTITDFSQTPASERLGQIRSQLFFIVGCGRSGTTLLQSALCSNPEVSIPPETKFFEVYPGREWRYGSPRAGRSRNRCLNAIYHDQKWRGVIVDKQRFLGLAHAAEQTWEGLFLALLAAYADTEGTCRVGEKSPVHTRHVSRLMAAFPQGKFIHLLRDPRAVVHSRITAGFGSSLVAPNIERWREAAAMHLEYGRQLGSKRYLLLRYEDMVQQPEPVLRALCNFLDLAFLQIMLEPHRRTKQGFTERSAAWMENTLKPIFTSSIDRWRSEMPRSQIALVEHSLKVEMAEFGYELVSTHTVAPGIKIAGSRIAGIFERAWSAVCRTVSLAIRLTSR